MSNIGKKIFVAMSGGVDSSVTAALLKKEGHDVTGVHMVCAGPPIGGGCENSADRRDAMKVAAVLDIPFLTWDFREEYKREVYSYMISEYMAGRTPNPDVMCNKQIKFGIFLKKALENGADFIATGHYVCLKQTTRLLSKSFRRREKLGLPASGLRDSAAGSFRAENADNRRPQEPTNYRFEKVNEATALFKAKDQNKDQSYFLWTLTQEQLKHCLFPIGDYLKSEVRELAKKFKLPTSEKKDSQGLCFVGKVDFLDFLKEKIPSNAGDILDSSGKKIGTHDGAQFYTVGQRHGVFKESAKREARSAKPVYVAERDVFANTITVAEEKDTALYKKEIDVEKVNWISGAMPKLPFLCMARIRYRQPLQKVTIYGLKSMDYGLIFDVPQRAVAQGQSVVFYGAEGEMLGGGIIK